MAIQAKMNIYVKVETHKALKMLALLNEETMLECIARLVREEVERGKPLECSMATRERSLCGDR